MMPGSILRNPIGLILGRARQPAVLAEEGGRAQQVFLLELLIGKDDDEMVEPGLVDRLDGVVVRLLAQVDAADLRADVLGQRDDLEAGLGHDVHGAVSRRTSLVRVHARLMSRVPCEATGALRRSEGARVDSGGVGCH